MKKKLLIIRSQEESGWGSCKVISPNLFSSYEMNAAFFHIEYFEITKYFLEGAAEENFSCIENLAKKIQTFAPDELVFIDHKPLPIKILNFLSYFIPYKKLPNLVIHIYGDFTYFAHDWTRFNEKFKSHKVKFIVASQAQFNLVSFFSRSNENIEQFLFPVNEKEYFFDSMARSSFREKMKIEENEKVILYSGRVSLQKNVDLVIREFVKFAKTSKTSPHLWIVGAFDNVGATFMGVKNYEGFMYARVQKLLNTLPEEIKKRIHFFGIKKKNELQEIKSAADLFISLSLYHDEDYGMSPAEALSCGLPSILTNWGGYYSFESKDKWLCRLVPVEITDYGHKINVLKIQEFLKEITEKNLSHEERVKKSLAFQEEFSISASAKKLKKIIEKDFVIFEGFNSNLYHYSSAYWSVEIGREISKEMSPSTENFYYEVYKNYIKEDQASE